MPLPLFRFRVGRRSILLLLIVAGVALLGAACGGDDNGPGTAAAKPAGTSAAAPAKQVTLRLGYFANLTHAQALVGVSNGDFQKELGTNVKLETKVFNAGPAAIEALFAGDIDATYVGPNPSINGFVQSHGEALRIVSGAASAGALFIVRPDAKIATPKDLANKKLATPQLGNTQDVALRSYLKQNGLKAKEDGGNVTILPTDNATTLTLFQKGDIDGAWVPEPWATRLIVEDGGQVFVDERTLWPNGDFVTTQLVVSTDFLKKNPDAVAALVRANVKETQFLNDNAEQAKQLVNKAIADLSNGKGLDPKVLDGAWKNLRFTYDPIASSLAKNAQDAYAAGLLKDKANLTGIYSLDILNKVVADLKLPPIVQPAP